MGSEPRLPSSNRPSTSSRTTTTFKTFYMSFSRSMKRRTNWQWQEPTKRVMMKTLYNSVYPGGRGQEMLFNWLNDTGKPKSHIWCSTVKQKRTKRRSEVSWQMGSRKIHDEDFFARPNAARPQLGVALRSMSDWALRAWMLSFTPGILLLN